jgi:hypothetical protein
MKEDTPKGNDETPMLCDCRFLASGTQTIIKREIIGQRVATRVRRVHCSDDRTDLKRMAPHGGL